MGRLKGKTEGLSRVCVGMVKQLIIILQYSGFVFGFGLVVELVSALTFHKLKFLLSLPCAAASPSTHSLPLLLSVVTGLTGISVKILFLWPNIIEVGRDGDDLYFSVGIASASFPIDNFYECPQCGCGLNCGSQQVEWHDYMYAILLLITESEKRRVLERLVKTMKLALLIIFFLEKLFMKF
nr:uncharacterized protein LOC112040705 [Quercus suber]